MLIFVLHWCTLHLLVFEQVELGGKVGVAAAAAAAAASTELAVAPWTWEIIPRDEATILNNVGGNFLHRYLAEVHLEGKNVAAVVDFVVVAVAAAVVVAAAAVDFDSWDCCARIV